MFLLLKVPLVHKKVREKSRECHNHKPQPFPDSKRKRKPTNPNNYKRTKSTKISSLSPKRGNRNTKRTEKHKNKMTHGKTYNKSPRTINHKATKSKTNTGTTALERSVEQPYICLGLFVLFFYLFIYLFIFLFFFFIFFFFFLFCFGLCCHFMLFIPYLIMHWSVVAHDCSFLAVCIISFLFLRRILKTMT